MTIIGFKCPVTDERVVQPCGLEACRFHVDYRWSRNCILAYLDEQAAESLSVDEIAFLYRRAPEDIKAVLDDAMVTLRSTAITQQCPREFSLVPTDQVCCVCESRVEDIPRSLRFGVHAYCSRECRESKPPAVMNLEITQGLAIDKILEWTFRRYRTLGLVEQALGVPRWVLHDITQRYLGRPLDSYFEKRETKTLVRRTWHAPEWVDTMVTQVQRKIPRPAWLGPQTVDLTGYRDRLEPLLS